MCNASHSTPSRGITEVWETGPNPDARAIQEHGRKAANVQNVLRCSVDGMQQELDTGMKLAKLLSSYVRDSLCIPL